MRAVISFLRKERLYVLLLVFVVVTHVAIINARGKSDAHREKRGKTAFAQEVLMQRGAMERALAENKPLAFLLTVTTLLLGSVLILGIVIDVLVVSRLIARRPLDIRTYAPGPASWNIVDVSRVIILFLFFGYITIIIESALIDIFPCFKSDNFRMIVNSAFLDCLTVFFILTAAVVQYKDRLISLGISAKRCVKNIFYGIVGYIAIVPILALVLVAIMVIVNLTKYVPERQPVVELFLKEESAFLLAFTSLFAAIVGPFIEELFFRGFMYSAFKRYAGVFWATFLTAAIFSALHSNIVGFLPIMVLGVLLAYLYEKTGTLVSSITVHIMHNMSMVFLVFLVKQLRG